MCHMPTALGWGGVGGGEREGGKGSLGHSQDAQVSPAGPGPPLRGQACTSLFLYATGSPECRGRPGAEKFAPLLRAVLGGQGWRPTLASSQKGIVPSLHLSPTRVSPQHQLDPVAPP